MRSDRPTVEEIEEKVAAEGLQTLRDAYRDFYRLSWAVSESYDICQRLGKDHPLSDVALAGYLRMIDAEAGAAALVDAEKARWQARREA